MRRKVHQLAGVAVLGSVVLLSACSGSSPTDPSASTTPASSASASDAPPPNSAGSAEPSGAVTSEPEPSPAPSSSPAETPTAQAPTAEQPAAPDAPQESAAPVNPAGTTAADSTAGPCDEFIDPTTVATFVPRAGPAEDFTGGDVVQRCTWTSGAGASLRFELRDALAAGITGLQGAYLDTPVPDLANAAAGSTLSEPAGEDPTASIQVYSTTADSAYLLELNWKAPGATPDALVPVAKTVLGL